MKVEIEAEKHERQTFTQSYKMKNNERKYTYYPQIQSFKRRQQVL